VSITFDDARPSQVDVGVPLLDRFGVKATFFVTPTWPTQVAGVDKRLDAWRRAARSGHEIGNHLATHPCSFNFFPDGPLDRMSLRDIADEIDRSQQALRSQFGRAPTVFAYPCGEKHVGRGPATQSYVPLIATRFAAGRGFAFDARANAADSVDLHQIASISIDDRSFEDLRPALDQALLEGGWLVLTGHDLGAEGRQSVRSEVLEQVLRYLTAPASRVWIAPLGDVAKHVAARQAAGNRSSVER
jgi:peptidoglycan/xylan/chitin deacetylase (PgdA/CDA1 family)